MDHFENWYCEVWILFLQQNVWSEAQHFFQQMLECYGYNHLGVISFECIAGVTLDRKFAGSVINQSTQIVLMDEWANGSLCSDDAKRVFASLLLIYATFIFCNKSTLQYALFSVDMIFCKDIYNSSRYVHFTFKWDIDGSKKRS